MKYWRMQLHPKEAKIAVQHTVKSLAAGFIGLDFDDGDQPGDLRLANKKDSRQEVKDFWCIKEMERNDKVLVFVHNFPFALVNVAGEYDYTTDPVEVGVWFKHFRRVDKIKYYADWKTNPRDWKNLVMPCRIQGLIDTESASYKLIEQWP